MLDTSAWPVVDVHCHPFTRQVSLSADQFVDLLSFPSAPLEYMAEGGLEVDDDLIAERAASQRDVVYFSGLLRQLAAFLGCAPDLDAVVAARSLAAQDYASYVERLYADCKLVALVVDVGYPTAPAVDLARFKAEMPVEVVPIYRIEPLIARLLQEDVGWSEFRRRYDEAIARALERDGFRGLKSIIAYRTGLDISPLSRSPEQGRQALEVVRRGRASPAIKLLRDHLFCRAMELCIEHDVPFQVHTGMGDYQVNLAHCRPALLMDVLRFPAFRACRVQLVHAGYPYHAEAGYMANVLPRVYCDVSEGIPFAAGAAGRILGQLLEMAPVSKVMYGSDGLGLPEVNYVGAQLARASLARALTGLIEAGLLTESEADRAAGLILAGNARRLYGLER